MNRQFDLHTLTFNKLFPSTRFFFAVLFLFSCQFLAAQSNVWRPLQPDQTMALGVSTWFCESGPLMGNTSVFPQTETGTHVLYAKDVDVYSGTFNMDGDTLYAVLLDVGGTLSGDGYVQLDQTAGGYLPQEPVAIMNIGFDGIVDVSVLKVVGPEAILNDPWENSLFVSPNRMVHLVDGADLSTGPEFNVANGGVLRIGDDFSFIYPFDLADLYINATVGGRIEIEGDVTFQEGVITGLTFNTATLQVLPGGTFTAQDTLKNFGGNVQVDQGGQFINEGIYVGSTDNFINDGQITNNQRIVSLGGTWQNTSQIQNNAFFQLAGAGSIGNQGTILNTDTLQAFTNFFNLGEVDNQGVIQTGQFFNNLSRFTNSPAGTAENLGVFVNDSLIDNRGIFLNSGSLIADEPQSELQNRDEFENKAGGQFVSDGIIHNYVNGTFTNEDTVEIGTATATYINDGKLYNLEDAYVLNRGTFLNEEDGEWYNEGLLENTSQFTNEGLFSNLSTGDAEVLNRGLYTNRDQFFNQAAFTNSFCAYVFEEGLFDNRSGGILTNLGLWKVLSPTSNYNSGIADNQGIWWMVDPPFNLSLNSDTGITISDRSDCQSPVRDVLKNNTSSGWNIATTWYLDINQTQVAGTYDPNTNTFTKSIAADTFEVFFQILNGGCPYLVNHKVFIQTFPALENVVAGNAEQLSDPQFTWSYSQLFVDNSNDFFRIYRDGNPTPIATIDAINTFNTYTDNSAIPGQFHSYQLEYIKSGCAASEPVFTLARGQADGQISGKVTTPSSVGIKDVEVCAFPDPATNQALLVDGTGDKVSSADTSGLTDITTEVTVEAWIKAAAWKSQSFEGGIVSNEDEVSVNKFSGFVLRAGGANGTLDFVVGSNGGWQFTSSAGSPAMSTGQWYHVAGTYDGSTIRVFIDGEEAGSTAYSGTLTPSIMPLVIGQSSNTFAERAFNGAIDEVRVWKVARTAEQIKAGMDNILTGEEEGLVSYHRFNDDSLNGNPIAADYTVGGSHHADFMGDASLTSATDNPLGYCGESVINTGNYTIPHIYYGANGSDFNVYPFREGGGFVQGPFNPNNLLPPPIQVLDMNEGDRTETNVNFIDTSTYVMTGRVYYPTFGFGESISDCLQDSVLVVLRTGGTLSFVDSARTDGNGAYTITVPQAGNYVLEVSYADHTYQLDPEGLYSFTQNGNVFGPFFIDQNLLDVDFENGTSRNVYYQVLGGCQNVLYDDVQVRIYSFNTSPNNCVDTTFWTGPSNVVNLDLPAQQYRMEVINVLEKDATVPSAGTALQRYPNALDINLNVEADTGVVLWHKEAELVVTYPEEVEIENCGETYRFMEQFERYPLIIQLSEIYSADEFSQPAQCPVDSALITIVDPASDRENADQVEIRLEPEDQGNALYFMEPFIVNSVAPFKQPLNISGETIPTSNLIPASLATWVDSISILGSATQPGSFLTVSPELPRLILRDPPGDQSKSYYKSATTNCVKESYSRVNTETGSVGGKIKVGAEFRLGSFVGLVGGVTFSVKTKIVSDISNVTTEGSRNTNSSELETCLTLNQALETSSSETVFGPDGNVYVSSAYNLAFSPTVDVYLDTLQGCVQVVDSSSFIIGKDSVLTTFYRSEASIKNTLIPNLEQIRDGFPAETDPNAPYYPLSDTAFYYQNQIDIWNQILAYNQKLVDEAQSSPDAESITFDGSAGPITRGITRTNSSTFALEYHVFFNTELATETGIEVGGIGTAATSSLKIRQESTNATANTIRNQTEAGFVLDDNDSNDYMDVVVAIDPVYNTPVFQIGAGGRTSCPYEGAPTGPLDIFDIALDQYQMFNVPDDQAANLQFTIQNQYQLNTPGSRDFIVRLLSGSNELGARMLLGGTELNNFDKYINSLSSNVPNGNPNAVQNLALAVERANSSAAWDYYDLQIVAYPSCSGLGPNFAIVDKLTDTVTLDVRFERSCSDINFLNLTDNWLINEGDNDAMQITLSDYVATNLDNVVFQYRRNGLSWNSLDPIPASELQAAGSTYDFIWDVSNDIDGNYEIRIKVNCSGGVFSYSPILSGKIDRGFLLLFGNTQPADGVFQIGDEISATFDANLICFDIDSKVQMVTDDGRVVSLKQVDCGFSKIILEPLDFEWCDLEDRFVTVTLQNLVDEDYNTTNGPVTWTFRVDRQDGIEVTANPTDATGMNAADGSIDVSVSGGVPPYTYAWSNGATTQDLANLLPGTYAYTITDDDCARAVDSLEISYPGAPTCADGIMNGDETGVDCGGSCAPCDTEPPSNECAADSMMVMENPITDSLYHAAVHLESSGVVDPGTQDEVIFKAGTSIVLKPGFHAKPGATFTAQIEDCPVMLAGTDPMSDQNESADPVAWEAPTRDHQLISGLYVRPNPFRNATNLYYVLEQESTIHLAVFGPSGALIKVLAEGTTMPAGQHRVLFDGVGLPAGMYYVRLQTADQVMTRKMVLTKY